MPKNKRPNRKPGSRKIRKRIAADKAQSNKAEADSGAPKAKGARSFVKTYGSGNSPRSPISPAMQRRGSARGR